MKKFLALAIVCTLLWAACKKEAENKNPVCTGTAVVRWGGDPAADGLGWYLMDSVGGLKIYIPRNLPDFLKIDNQLVQVCLYETEELFLCHCAVPMKKYQITMIKKL